MKIQFKAFDLNNAGNFDQEKGGNNFENFAFPEDHTTKQGYRNFHLSCGWLLTPGIIMLTMICSLFTFYLLWTVVSLEKFTHIGTFLFVDVSKNKHEVQISWSNCGIDNFGKVNYLTVEPSPLNLHKNLTLTFDADVFQNIDAPLSLKVRVEKKIWIKWIPIPCIDSAGSCSYRNICAYSPYPSNTTCVLPGSENRLPCSCPILKGKYFAHKSTVHIEDPLKYLPDWLKKGEYRFQVDGFSGRTHVGCYKLHFTVTS